MQEIPLYLQLAFGKSDGESLTNDENDVCKEWATGIALEYMKVDTGDPRLLEYAALYDKLKNKQDAVWKKKVVADKLLNSKQIWWKDTHIVVSRAFSAILLFFKLLRRKS